MTEARDRELLNAEGAKIYWYRQGREEGMDYERAAIVAWLRQLAFITLRDDLAFADEHASALEEAANTIERSKHWHSPPVVTRF